VDRPGRVASKRGYFSLSRLLLYAAGLFVAVLVSEPMAAGCCDILKVDPAIPTSMIRACDPEPDGACGDLLFEGSLSVGESQSVCAAGEILVYQERDPITSIFQPPVTAVCDGTAVEI